MTQQPRQWVVFVDGVKTPVCGFRHPQRLREHVEKHFLNRKERWSQVSRGEFNPENFLPLPEPPFGLEWFEVTGQAAIGYERITEKATRGATLATRYFDPLHEAESVCVVSTTLGIFSIFRVGEVSDLRTSFRPKPRNLKTATVTDFGRAARKKYLRTVK